MKLLSKAIQAWQTGATLPAVIFATPKAQMVLSQQGNELALRMVRGQTQSRALPIVRSGKVIQWVDKAYPKWVDRTARPFITRELPAARPLSHSDQAIELHNEIPALDPREGLCTAKTRKGDLCKNKALVGTLCHVHIA